METLVLFATVGILPVICNYFGTIYILKKAFTTLSKNIEAFELKDHCRRELLALQKNLSDILLSRVESNVLLVAIVEDENANTKMEMPNLENEAQVRITKYYFELGWLAYNKRLPIWTDDFFTGNIREFEGHVNFGTDLFLEKLRVFGVLDDTTIFQQYEELIHWSYNEMSYYTPYLLWLITQRKETQIKKALQYYQQALTVKINRIENTEGKLGLIGDYLRVASTIFAKCFRNNISVSDAAKLFAIYDVSETFTKVISNLSVFIYLWLEGLLIACGEKAFSTAVTANPYEQLFSWFYYTLLEAGYEQQVVEQAWFLWIDEIVRNADKNDQAVIKNVRAKLLFIIKLAPLKIRDSLEKNLEA